MKTAIQRTKWTSAGLLLALTCGTPAVADDTELLLINPSADLQTTPNVLLIIDSSGSMGSNSEQTRQIYDSSLEYAGACDPNYLYWTPYKDVRPSCANENYRILKSSFLCVSGALQINGIGIYRNTMAQFRAGDSGLLDILKVKSAVGSTSSDAMRWQRLDPANSTDIVECAKDSGKHGDGTDAFAVYAQSGGDVDPFTPFSKLEVAWGSWPTSQGVTVYDGKYLNYLNNPVTILDTRISIVQNTAVAILNSIEGINVGLMRFNNNQGGPVLKAMQDLDANRADIVNTVKAIPAGGRTPVSETLYEAALYWRGLPAYYGEIVNETPTDPAALSQLTPEVYQQPLGEVCSKNFNVLLTDGEPVDDAETPSLVGNLPNWFGTLGYAGCTGAAMGDCLDDIAAYLFTDDISDQPGQQTVVTHTIGFAIDLPILREAAERGGGDYFLASDVESLTLALLEIVNDINDRSLSFAAPAVAVNTFNRTRNFNDLYLTTFAAAEQVHWPGNLKKYKILDGLVADRNDQPAVDPNTGLFFDSATSYWGITPDGNDVRRGGAVAQLPDPAVRRLFTNNTADPDLTAGTNQLSLANELSFELVDFGLSGAEGEPTIAELIRFARGEDVNDVDLDPNTSVYRWMGDPLHSQPAAVVYGGTEANPDVVVYTANNAGFLHAVNGTTGEELWSFMPKEHLSNLPIWFINPDAPFKVYGVDGDIVPVMADRDNDGVIEPVDGDFVYILFGMRRGGNAYYALDVTDKNNPRVMWRSQEAGYGQSWSRPVVTRMDMDDPGLNNDKAVVVIGGGYDTVHDTIVHPATPDAVGAGIYFLDLQSGEVLWRAGADDQANLQLAEMTRAIPSQVTVVDITGDGLADRMYASDMGGQILRFDIFNGNSPDGFGVDALVTGGVYARLGAEGLATPSDAETRRFYTSPDVSIFNDNIQNRRFIAVSIGSGYRSHPLDSTNTDRFYSIRDPNVFNRLSQGDYDGWNAITDNDLVEISGTVGTTLGADDAGWRFTLPANQKVLSTSVTFNNEVFFVAFSPDADGAAVCSAGQGRNFLYRVSVINGDPITPRDNIVPGEEDQERVTDLAQGGIAPSPNFLFPSPEPDCMGDECAPPPIGCVGVECFDPGFENRPVRTLWTQDGVE
ncbi:MAG TPA: hypothetical protein VLA06_00050 [Woeseiaceae bacterium]|nr:hypothetical protein [Woeseiaceae bacterium]